MSLQDRLRQNRDEQLSREKNAGAAFMETNGQKEGVVTLDNGIQYLVLEEGTGPKPAPTATIKAHYRGALINGNEFDSSFRRNQPFSAPLNNLIKGWQLVIPLMPTGSTWRLWIPSDLAYGDRGAGGQIPGGATLVFDIQLLEIL